MNLAQFDLRKWETNYIKLKKQMQISESVDRSDTVPSTDYLQLTTRMPWQSLHISKLFFQTSAQVYSPKLKRQGRPFWGGKA